MKHSAKCNDAWRRRRRSENLLKARATMAIAPDAVERAKGTFFEAEREGEDAARTCRGCRKELRSG